jgi:hypothetical protein
MPNGPRNVTLTVDSTNGYAFTGGTQGNGDCNNAVGQGAAPVLVTLSAPAGYRIRGMNDEPPGVQLSGTGSSQMNSQVTGQGQSATIANPCTAAANVDYTVNVVASDGTNIACHPKIVNT